VRSENALNIKSTCCSPVKQIRLRGSKIVQLSSRKKVLVIYSIFLLI
jgi:hypothetical protein